MDDDRDDEPADDFVSQLDLALYAPDPVARDAARSQIAQKVTPAILSALLDLLDARQKATRQRTARILAETEPRHSRDAIEAALLDPTRPVRARVALARLLTAQAEGELPVLALGLQAAAPEVRRACATVAAPFAALVAALADSEAEVVTQAAWSLEVRDRPIDPAAVADAAQRHGAVGPLARLVARSDPDHPGLALAAQGGDAVALDHLADPIALRAMLADPARTDRAAVAWALTRVGALPTSAARDPDPAVRAAGARGFTPGHPAVRGLADDPDPGVAWLARKALAGHFDGDALVERLGPHARADAPSAQAPFGLRPGDAIEAVPRAHAALALWQTAFDVNLGVAVRSAEAAGLREVFVVGRAALLRSPARGTDLALPVHAVSHAAALVRLARAGGYQIVAVQQTPASVPYHQAVYPPRPLFVLGAEGEGLPDRLRVDADLCVEIPLFGVIDSLNVAAAATTVMFHWRVHHGG